MVVIAQRVEADHRIADAQRGTGPVALGQAVNAANHDVGPQTPHVASKRGNGTIGRDEQRQDIEAIDPSPLLEPA